MYSSLRFPVANFPETRKLICRFPDDQLHYSNGEAPKLPFLPLLGPHYEISNQCIALIAAHKLQLADFELIFDVLLCRNWNLGTFIAFIAAIASCHLVVSYIYV